MATHSPFSDHLMPRHEPRATQTWTNVACPVVGRQFHVCVEFARTNIAAAEAGTID